MKRHLLCGEFLLRGLRYSLETESSSTKPTFFKRRMRIGWEKYSAADKIAQDATNTRTDNGNIMTIANAYPNAPLAAKTFPT